MKGNRPNSFCVCGLTKSSMVLELCAPKVEIANMSDGMTDHVGQTISEKIKHIKMFNIESLFLKRITIFNRFLISPNVFFRLE